MSTFAKRILTLLLSLALVFGLAMPAYAATGETPSDTDVVIPVPDSEGYLSSLAQAGIQLRAGMKSRQQTVVIKVMTTRTDLEAFVAEIHNIALQHTGLPTEGDYLRWQIGGYEVSVDGTSDGTYSKLTLTYNLTYYTSAEQETELDTAVNTVLDALDVYDASDYDKIKAVYDYMCQNIAYDYEGLAASDKMVYTAYDALVNKKAVCQGYANLFYRLMLELDVDTRIITGTSMDEATQADQPHAWNIVKLEGEYYNADATWDAARAQADLAYAYFLRSSTSFENHTRDEEYTAQAFDAAYPMAAQNYTTGDNIPGDMDGNGEVNVDDVIRLLLFVTMPQDFQIDAEADFNNDSDVNVDDVIRLLLFVTMPEDFPLTA